MNKELLFKDLCARLPYGVKCYSIITNGKPYTIGGCRKVLDDFYVEVVGRWVPISTIKPYLRSMSSMTEDEKIELKQISNDYLDEWEHTKTSLERWKLDAKGSYLRFVFYNSHHFDWNDLIPKGLAIEVTEGMYKTE